LAQECPEKKEKKKPTNSKQWGGRRKRRNQGRGHNYKERKGFSLKTAGKTKGNTPPT